MRSPKMTIRTNILIHFILVVSVLALALTGVQYYFSEKMAKEAVTQTFHQTAHKIVLELQEHDKLSREMLYQIESHPSIRKDFQKELPLNMIKHFVHTLKRYVHMYAIYLGYSNGDLFEVINMHVNEKLYTHYKAKKKTRWTIIRIYDTPNGRKREFIFLDENFHIIESRSETSVYNATKRIWYHEAIAANGVVIRSDPYLFSNLKKQGITYSKKLKNKNSVLALDFTLNEIDNMLDSLQFSSSNNIYLYTQNGHLMASTDKIQSPTENMLKSMIENKTIETIKKFGKNDETEFLMLIPLSGGMGNDTYVGISVSYSEIIAPYRKTIYYALAIAFALLLMFIPLTRYLTDHIVSPLRSLMEENELIKQREFDKVKAVQTNIIEFMELSDSQIKMSRSIQEYQKQQEILLDSFIMLIADAIDAKSHYTGAHCQRVPVIATMLAQEAEANKEGAFKNFSMGDKDAWEAFERAAWLHDCGKITTPEYVVDKATKLETIYNRIHEIRTRFEVLWRDIDIAYYERLINGEDQNSLKSWRRKEQQRLSDDFAFIATCNLGGEYMEEEKIKRLKNIAKRTWIRHFDDRLGLGEEELARYPQSIASLPATEKLLDDKVEHCIERIGFDTEHYEKECFTMEVPHYLYNRGELYNLCIEKGTLTKEERFKINEHIIMTIKMLEQLPFPENMRQIPVIAGEHHETVDGRGYPRGLKGKALSIPSRILAIADIFEALTASDRPYKKAKTLSGTLKIMKQMAEEEHIDAALFELFVRSGIYLEYGREYLKEEQIDRVDVDALFASGEHK